MQNGRSRFLVGVAHSLAIALAVSSVAANGQEASSAAAAPDETASGGLEDIVVTATRTQSTAQKVPTSLIALSGDLLADTNITSTGQLTALTPTLQLTGGSSGRGATQFGIRGIGTASFSHLLESSVSLVIDGVPLGRPDLGFTDLYDLERVEVLSGPQGTLFGKNATAGVISVVGKRPQLGEFSGSGRLSYAVVEGSPTNASNWVAQGTLNLATSENSALRINASYTDMGALLRQVNPNSGNDIGKAQVSVKTKFLWEPSDNLTFYIVGDYSSSEGLGLGIATQRGFLFSGADADVGIINPGPKNAVTSANARLDLNYQVGGALVDTSYTLGDWTVNNITAYRKYTGGVFGDNDGYSINFDEFVATFKYHQFSNEFRVISPRDKFVEVQAGLYYFDGYFSRNDGAGNGGLGGLPALVPGFLQNRGATDSFQKMRSKSYATYGEATFNLSDRFRAIAAGRFTYDRTRLSSLQDTRFTFSPPSGGAAGRVLSVSQRKNKESDLSYKFAVQYDLADQAMVYASYARGYKGGGYNLQNRVATQSGAYVEPEIAKVGEVGFKSTFLDRKVRFNVTAFYGKYYGFQERTFDLVLNASVFSNAGLLRTQGFEAQLDVRPVQGLTLTSGVAYVDAIYKDFLGASCYGGQTAAQGCVGNRTDASGNRLTNAPKWTANVSADYEFPISERFNGSVRGEYSYRTKVNFLPTPIPATAQSGYGLANAYLGFFESDKRWEISLYCKNCFDKRFVNYISTVQGVNGSYRQNFSTDSFRQIGASLSVKY